MNATTKCRTIVIEDSPSNKDYLAQEGEMGPHDRVAKAISEVILSNHESGGKMIGLEGGWGSGKSTVINLVRKEIQKQSNDISFFYFDAWAHEGDPLRRTYLESLIKHFQSSGWISNQKWDNRLDELANKRKVIRTRTIPEATSLGTVFAISILLIPIGIPFLRAAVTSGITFDAQESISWPFWIGLLLCSAPFLVLLWNCFKRKKPGQITKWAFVSGNVLSETKQDTTETPEPTSIEFESAFRALMKEALPKSQIRQAIIVLDNLDRVESKFTLSIWSTLQTFLQHRNDVQEDWYKKVWILIPYDPKGLRQVWTNHLPQEDDSAPNSNKTHSKIVADSFIDKSFQLRFEVPPLVLSNWKSFLIDLIQEALPDHATEKESLNRIYRIYNIGREEVQRSPTPRELKLFVNQVGSIHRQWEHTFPLSHVAYYVMLRRQQRDVAGDLLSGLVPDKRIQALVESNLKTNLAGLVFNVSPTLGQQILLRDPIVSALAKGDGDILATLKENHGEGFWAVFEEVASTGLEDSDLSFLTSALRSLNQFLRMTTDSRSEFTAMVNALRNMVFKVENWTFDETIAEGLSALIQLDKRSEVAAGIVQRVKSTMNMKKENEVPQEIAHGILKGVFSILTALKGNNHQDLLENPMTLPIDASTWIDLTSSETREQEYWRLIQPKDGPTEVSERLGSIVDKGEFTPKHFNTITSSQASFGNDSDWTKLGESAEKRLQAGINVTNQEIGSLIKCLYLLKRILWAPAAEILDRLVQGGHITHFLYQSDPSNKQVNESKAWCILCFLDHKPDAGSARGIGHSAAGHANLTNLLNKDDEALAQTIVTLAMEENLQSLLFKVVDTRNAYDPLIVGCLKIASMSENYRTIFDSQTVIARWSQLIEYFSKDEFEQLMSRLVRQTTIVDDVMEAEFQAKDAPLYEILIEDSNSEDLISWCNNGLGAISKDDWLLELKQKGKCVDLAIFLDERSGLIKLKTAFQDGLCEFSIEVMNGDVTIDDSQKDRFGSILSCLASQDRRVLQKRMISKAKEVDGKISDLFFELFGDEISSLGVLKDYDVVVKLFSPILRNKSHSGLRWLAGLFKDGSVLDAYSDDEDGKLDFKNRLQSDVSRSGEDAALNVILVEIATSLQIDFGEKGSNAHFTADG